MFWCLKLLSVSNGSVLDDFLNSLSSLSSLGLSDHSISKSLCFLVGLYFVKVNA